MSAWRNDPAGSGKIQYGTWNTRTREHEWKFATYWVWERLSDHYVSGTAGHFPGAGFRAILVTDDWYGVARLAILAARDNIPQPGWVRWMDRHVRTLAPAPPRQRGEEANEAVE